MNQEKTQYQSESDVGFYNWFTPFNILTAIVLALGLVLTIVRFTQGIGSVTNLDNNNPWGLWIGFDLLCGVALAAGGIRQRHPAACAYPGSAQ